MTDTGNRLYRGDCKSILKDLIEEGIKVDLIYLDPPFNSSRVYNMIFDDGGISAQQKAFHDMWNFTERAHQLQLDFVDLIRSLNDIPESFKEFIKAWVRVLSDGTADDKKLLNYLMYMTERLILMKKILAPEGSIYFHCDGNVSHYIKIIMDGIFGRHNFRNEIIWIYEGRELKKTAYNRKHDNILFYSKGKKMTFNWETIATPYKESSMKAMSRFLDDDGQSYLLRYTKGGGFAPKSKEGTHGVYRQTLTNKVPPRDWVQIDYARKNERRGYETQKPLELLRNFVKVSSNENDLILDPFCGCGTSIAAAIELGRKWIGIDISGDAVNEIEARIKEMRKVYLTERCEYDTHETNPETMREYERLNAYEKQDWLIRRINGFPNPRKSGDGGVDGELTIHLGEEKWGKMVFSVKTGKQCSPAMVRELRGTMQQENATMGGLILDRDPSAEMINKAEAGGLLNYELKTEDGIAEQSFNKVQILTSQEIIDGKSFIHPPTLRQKKNENRHKGDLI